MKPNPELPADVLRSARTLSSEKNRVDLLRHQVFYRADCEADREILYAEAKRRGLLRTYDFSGIAACGVSRRDAITTLMLSTFRKSFGLLRRNFGSSARFVARPRQFRSLGVDFYWKRAKIGLVITGPTFDDLRRGDRRRTRDREQVLYDLCEGRNSFLRVANRLSVMIVPYYDIWHNPTAVVANVRGVLFDSGKYPRLARGG